jgi:hypothetical protein
MQKPVPVGAAPASRQLKKMLLPSLSKPIEEQLSALQSVPKGVQVGMQLPQIGVLLRAKVVCRFAA